MVRLGEGDIGGDFLMRLEGKPPVSVYACYCHPSWTVGEAPCTVDNFYACCTVSYGGCNAIVGSATIQKPASLAGQAVRVSVAGFFDDDISIDGSPVGNCRPAGDVSHSFLMPASANSFELGAVDSYGGCGHGVLELSFERAG